VVEPKVRDIVTVPVGAIRYTVVVDEGSRPR